MITIRIALNTDIEEIQSLYRNTVLVINRRDYSQAEVEDWASCGDDPSKIEGMIKTHYFIVAVNRQSEIVGFSSITPQGYLHSMFIHKDFQGKGVATLLLNEIERYAVAAGITRLPLKWSITARPFFEKARVYSRSRAKTAGLISCLLLTIGWPKALYDENL